MTETSHIPVHVVPDRRGRWRVHREGDERPVSEHATATEAELAARRLGQDVIVHDRYGRIRHDPMPRRRDG